MDTLIHKRDLIKFGWQKYKEHAWFLFLMLVAILVVTTAAGGFPPLGIIVGIFVSISVITITLELADGRTPVMADAWKKYRNWRIFVNYVLASLIAAVIIGIGFLLLILPGIYLALRLQFYRYLVVDKEDIKPWLAIKESWRMTEGHTWSLFLFLLLIIGLNILGVLALGLGLFVSVPVSFIAYASLYRKLLQNVSLAPAA
jgi:uncharacterized membrane protein